VNVLQQSTGGGFYVVPVGLTGDAVGTAQFTLTGCEIVQGSIGQSNTCGIGTAGNVSFVNAAGVTYILGGAPYIIGGGEETEEQKRQREEWLKAQAEIERRAQQAEERALALLEEIVGAEAARRYRELMYHEMLGASGRRYRLRPRDTVQVMVADRGDEVDYTLCVVLGSVAPPTDKVITLALLLGSGAEGERIVNETGIRRQIRQAA